MRADQKEAMAKAIMKKAKMDPAPIRKPKFLKIGQTMTTTSLSDLVGEGSGHILIVISRSAEWPQDPPNMWSQSEDYVTAATFATHQKSVYDASERAVKLIEDYHECVTSDEETCQQLIQAVEWHWQHMPLSPKRQSQDRRHRTPVRNDYRDWHCGQRLGCDLNCTVAVIQCSVENETYGRAVSLR